MPGGSVAHVGFRLHHWVPVFKLAWSLSQTQISWKMLAYFRWSCVSLLMLLKFLLWKQNGAPVYVFAPDSHPTASLWTALCWSHWRHLIIRKRLYSFRITQMHPLLSLIFGSFSHFRGTKLQIMAVLQKDFSGLLFPSTTLILFQSTIFWHENLWNSSTHCRNFWNSHFTISSFTVTLNCPHLPE
jgi:hypothetical protein